MRCRREARPADLAAIAALEGQVAGLRQQLEAAEQRGREDGIHKGRLMELAATSPFPAALARVRAERAEALRRFIEATNTPAEDS